MDQPFNLSDADMARIEALVQSTRQAIKDDVEVLVRRQVEPLQEQTRALTAASTDSIMRDQAEPLLIRIRTMLLETVEEMARRQIEPVIERTQQMMLQLVAEVLKQHAAPLVDQVREALQRSMEEVAGRHMQPILQLTRINVQEKAKMASEFADSLVSRLKASMTEPVTQVLRHEMPAYVHWLGRRLLAYVLAATFFALAGIFLVLGIVQGLQHAGVPPFLTHAAGGLTALAGGSIFLWFTWRDPPTGGRPQDGARS